jgi:hypothetical protein
MRPSFVSSFFLCVVVACGGATTTTLGSADGTNPGGSGDGSSGGNDASATSQSSSGSTSFDTSNDASATTSACGEGAGGDTCGKGEWCNRGKGICSGSGICQTRPPPPPPSCPAYPDMYCGCNGQTYCSADDAHNAGIEIAVYGPCTVPCGPYTCDAVTQYCDHGQGGPPPLDGGTSEVWSCKTFASAGCSENRTCACVQSDPAAKGELCNEPKGHVQVEHLWP